MAAHSTHNTHVHTHHTYTHTRYTSHAHDTHVYVSRTYTHNTHACTQAHITHNTHGHTYTHRTDIMHTYAQQTHTHYTTNTPHTNIYVTQSHAHNIHVYTHARTHMLKEGGEAEPEARREQLLGWESLSPVPPIPTLRLLCPRSGLREEWAGSPLPACCVTQTRASLCPPFGTRCLGPGSQALLGAGQADPQAPTLPLSPETRC